MNSKIAVDERVDFADRLCSALIAAHQPTGPSAFARAYNLRADGAAVTSHAARKWLRGEALPTQEKVLILARWLNVHASWLRFGDAENGMYQLGNIGEQALTSEQLVLINDVISLPPSSQVIIRDMVDSFLRAALGGQEANIDRKTGRRK